MRQGQAARLEVQIIQAAVRYDSETMCVIHLHHGQISVPLDTCRRIDEWARWARPRMNIEPHGRCASAEGRHVSEYPDAARGGHILPPDLHSVLAVERVVCTKLPPVQRELVRCHFVRRDKPREIARVLGIHTHRLGDELRRSILMVKNCLTRI